MGYVVVIIADLYNTLALNNSAVLIIEAVNNAVFNNHFAVLVKLVLACGNKTVGEIVAEIKCSACIDLALLCDVVHTVSLLNKTYTLYITVNIVAVFINAGICAYINAVIGKYCKVTGVVGELDEANALMAITHLIEAIGIAVNLNPLNVTNLSNELVEVGTIVVSCAAIKSNPYAVNNLTGLFKLIGGNSLGVSICEGFLCYGSKSFGIKVIPLFFDLEPACSGCTELRVMIYALFILNKTCVFADVVAVFVELIVCAVNLNNAGVILSNAVDVVLVIYKSLESNAVCIGLTVGELAVKELAAVLALKNAVDYLVGVTCCGNYLVP